MREVDRVMVEDLHIELVQMMENAGRGLAELAIDRFSPGSVTVLAGPGGNGGGGPVGARHLANRGCQVQVVLSGPGRLTTVPAHQADILGRMGIRIAELFVHSIYNGYWLLGRAGKGPAAPTAGAAGAVGRNQIAGRGVSHYIGAMRAFTRGWEGVRPMATSPASRGALPAVARIEPRSPPGSGNTMPLTAFYAADGSLLAVEGGALVPVSALKIKIAQLLGVTQSGS